MNAAREASLVIGLGQPDRGDDAVGPVVAARLRDLVGDSVVVLTREDPTALVQTWDGYRVAVVIDSVLTGAEPGTLTIRQAGAAAEPLPTHAFTAAGRGGSHAFGVAGAVELSRTLGTLPEQLAIVGVEAASFDHGPMTDPVIAAIDDAVATVVATLARGISALTESEAGSCA
ncbi:hydrogenase maturation protease [Demequina zhanjiangensis]|uniref:Hydrogenase maturation protease n=1 Tax=Demequina zhanjiangensis TaxID=3051659 RepID=A0ABT8G2W9_9MICO|nr:hydrogenase maturation protease [Demequina sp. SYSU T00b26]MDN4473483.1 hydrogenase maturation protease [Demequina sp. SYSU T00b26]